MLNVRDVLYQLCLRMVLEVFFLMLIKTGHPDEQELSCLSSLELSLRRGAFPDSGRMP